MLSNNDNGVPETPTTTLPPEEFKKLCEDVLKTVGDVSIAARDKIIADLQLRNEHSCEYAAWLDCYETKGGKNRLNRTILACDSDITVVSDRVAELPSEDIPHLTMDYIDPLDADTELPGCYVDEVSVV